MTQPSPITVHLITQRDQPYGSVRVCCEICGAYGAIMDGPDKYTDSPELYERLPALFIACNKKKTLP